MVEQLVIVGAGGFGREVLDVVEAINLAAAQVRYEVVGVVDDAPSDRNLSLLDKRGVPYLGDSDELTSRLDAVAFSIGIGSPSARRAVAMKLEAGGARPITLVHPSASLGFDVQVGDGSVICAGARVTTNVVIGRYVHLNLNATVGHDSSLGDFVSINPLASVSGDCVLGDEVLVGVAGVILNGLTVGRGATVGGSACVVKDVAGGATVKGVPAR